MALRAAVAAQSTGLNFATVPIQPGARLSCISAPERNVSGSSSSADGADQRLALARQDRRGRCEKEAKIAASSAATSSSTSTPPIPLT